MATYAQRELRQGSFRGVVFETTSSDVVIGRRVQVFEYPQRDIPFVEDLGRSVRTIKFTAFIVGQDYIARMKELMPALVWAYDYYEDSEREGEIVERNNIAHAGFVPVRPLKLLNE